MGHVGTMKCERQKIRGRALICWELAGSGKAEKLGEM